MHLKLSRRAGKWLALSLSLMLVLLAAGCASDTGNQAADPTGGTGLTDEADAPTETDAKMEGPLYVVLVGTYVDETKLEAFADTLRAAVPDLTLEVGGISTGDPDADPMFAMAAMTQLAGRMASGEADLVLADAANGARNSRGEAFLPVSALEGLSDITGRELSFKALDDEGNETDEELAATGISLEGISSLAEIMPGSEVGAYVADMDDAAKTSASVEVINALLKMAGNG